MIKSLLALAILLLLTGCQSSPATVTVDNGHNKASGLIDTSDPGQVLTMDKIKEMVQVAAKKVYKEKKAEGMDFSSSPCLSNDFFPDWVADIAHNPRQAVDDDPANQCSYYREGKAHHFIELDENGEVIRLH